MAGIALASPRVWKVPSWLGHCAVRWFPRRFTWTLSRTIVRPSRKPIRLGMDYLEQRQPPTNVSPVGPGADWLAPLLRAAEQLPALAQTSPAFDFNHPFPVSRTGEQVNLARIPSRSAAQAEETSPLGP